MPRHNQVCRKEQPTPTRQGQQFPPRTDGREFAAFFELSEADSGPPPKDWNADNLGLMLYDVFDLSRPGRPDDSASISLFHSKVNRGVMAVPAYEGCYEAGRSRICAGLRCVAGRLGRLARVVAQVPT
jgi:hypothetical protein